MHDGAFGLVSELLNRSFGLQFVYFYLSRKADTGGSWDASEAVVKIDASLELQMPCIEGGRRSSRGDPKVRGAMVPDSITRLAGAAKAASGNISGLHWMARRALRQYRQDARRACGDCLEAESGGAPGQPLLTADESGAALEQDETATKRWDEAAALAHLQNGILGLFPVIVRRRGSSSAERMLRRRWQREQYGRAAGQGRGEANAGVVLARLVSDAQMPDAGGLCSYAWDERQEYASPLL